MAQAEAQESARTNALRLRAEDAEDLAVIAACLQDARTMIAEMAFDADDKRFMLAAKRYCRECSEGASIERECALVFDCIAEVKYRGLDTENQDRELTLLTIATEPGPSYLFHIDLVFDGDIEIQLRSHCLDAKLRDFGEAHKAEVLPRDHFVETG